LVGETFELDVTVPAGTRAEVILPDGRTEIAGPGTRSFLSRHDDERSKAIAR
jgi:alpha-L-rhamnosidase